MALLEQTKFDLDVDVYNTPDPELAFKLLRTRNTMRGYQALGTDYVEGTTWVLPVENS